MLRTKGYLLVVLFYLIEHNSQFRQVSFQPIQLLAIQPKVPHLKRIKFMKVFERLDIFDERPRNIEPHSHLFIYEEMVCTDLENLLGFSSAIAVSYTSKLL